MRSKECDVAIVGGGLAGLALAIQCARAGWSVVVFEKEDYPRHKVCGEYISHESTSFLESLGVPISTMDLPQIDTFRLTSHHNTRTECELQPGGFGLSRFALDASLAELAKQAGAQLRTKTRVTQLEGSTSAGFSVHTAQGETVKARLALGAWGRHGGLLARRSGKQGQAWIGVKYHLDAGPESQVIEIHSFDCGYAGVSRIENGRYCMAYLCHSEALNACNNDLKTLEKVHLAANPYLAERLSANALAGPLTTSQFHFGVSPAQPVATVGDSAGFIPPLSGNGMSLALRGAKHTFQRVQAFFEGSVDARTFDRHHQRYAQTYLNRRIAQGRLLQGVLTMKPHGINAALMKTFSHAPSALKTLTTLASGKPF